MALCSLQLFGLQHYGCAWFTIKTMFNRVFFTFQCNKIKAIILLHWYQNMHYIFYDERKCKPVRTLLRRFYQSEDFINQKISTTEDFVVSVLLIVCRAVYEVVSCNH